jgi:hypothetical protein
MERDMKLARSFFIAPLALCLASTVHAEPDLICSEIISAVTFGFVDGKMAYSFGTTVCNIGDVPIRYEDNTNRHPLITQTLYKLADGQMTQIGIGFVRHTSLPLSSNLCGLDCSAGSFDELGAGCSDTTSALINGVQGIMGPRREVEAQSGFFPYPFTSINQSGDAIYKRLQVDIDDVSDPNALYFVETQVITSDESTIESRNNNTSYRQVEFSIGSASASLVGPTYSQQPAINAWRDHGMGIGNPDPDVLIVDIQIPGLGFVHVASRLEQINDSAFQTSYLVHNQNGSTGMVGFVVPLIGDASDYQFLDVDYHDDSDGLIDDTDWTVTNIGCGFVSWDIVHSGNVFLNNELRWGTSYFYQLTSDDEPTVSQGSGVYLDFGDNYGLVFVEGIHAALNSDFVCEADLTGDGDLNFFDITVFLSRFGESDPSVDFNSDGVLNFFDVSMFLNLFNAGCPCS